MTAGGTNYFSHKAVQSADYDSPYVFVNPSGFLLWRFKYRSMGKEILLTFGKYPKISLRQVISRRGEARTLVASGNDPSAIPQEEAMWRQSKQLSIFGGEETFEFSVLRYHDRKEADV